MSPAGKHFADTDFSRVSLFKKSRILFFYDSIKIGGAAVGLMTSFTALNLCCGQLIRFPAMLIFYCFPMHRGAEQGLIPC